jgi:hypothetical protein
MSDFELKRTSEIVELLENLIVEMLRTKKVNATILKCYLDLLKMKMDLETKEKENGNNPMEKTQRLIEKMLNAN